jgi:hypothetical protein
MRRALVERHPDLFDDDSQVIVRAIRSNIWSD